MESAKPGLATLLRLVLLVALPLAVGRASAPAPDLPTASFQAASSELSPGHLPDGEASAEAGAFVGGAGFVEVHSAPRRPPRAQSIRTGLLPSRSLDGQRSRVRSVNLSRIGFARALAEASAGAATQATTLPPPVFV